MPRPYLTQCLKGEGGRPHHDTALSRSFRVCRKLRRLREKRGFNAGILAASPRIGKRLSLKNREAFRPLHLNRSAVRRRQFTDVAEPLTASACGESPDLRYIPALRRVGHLALHQPRSTGQSLPHAPVKSPIGAGSPFRIAAKAAQGAPVVLAARSAAISPGRAASRS